MTIIMYRIYLSAYARTHSSVQMTVIFIRAQILPKKRRRDDRYDRRMDPDPSEI